MAFSNPTKGGHARSAAPTFTHAREICIGTRTSSGFVREPAGGQCAGGCLPPPTHTHLQNKHEKTKKTTRRTRGHQKGARGHLSDTNLLSVLGWGGGVSSAADLHPRRSRRFGSFFFTGKARCVLELQTAASRRVCACWRAGSG